MNSWPLHYAFYVSAGYFALGAVSVVKINRIKGDGFQRWLKFAVYLAITFLLISLIIFQPSLYSYVMAMVCMVGGYEIVKNAAGSVSRKNLISYLIFYSVIAALFLRANYSLPSAILVYIYILVSLFDSFAQVTGQWIGKHRLSRVSPNKTWEGVAGGAVVALITAFFLIKDWLTPFHPVFPFVIIAGALFGDLIASWFKRICRIKDYSNLIPAHGGILDRFDSLIGATVFFYAALWLTDYLK